MPHRVTIVMNDSDSTKEKAVPDRCRTRPHVEQRQLLATAFSFSWSLR